MKKVKERRNIMARLQEIKEIPPFNLNKFYGLHIEPTGETLHWKFKNYK
jgi:hypothetical protein